MKEVNQVDREGKQTGLAGTLKRPVLMGILVCFFLASSASSVGGYLMYNIYTARYHSDISLAQPGIQPLQKAEALFVSWPQHPLDPQLAGQAQQEFVSAWKTFALLNGHLNSLPA